MSPNRFRSYAVPPPPATGNKEVDDALNAWASQLSDMQTQNLMDQERLPYTVSTFGTNNMILAAGTQAYIQTTVQLMGSESVVVFGAVQMQTTGTADTLLRITWPNGTTRRLSSQPIRLSQNLAIQTTLSPLHGSTGDYDVITTKSLVLEATLSYAWAVTPEYMSGGKMNFDLISSGTGSVLAGSIVVDIR